MKKLDDRGRKRNGKMSTISQVLGRQDISFNKGEEISERARRGSTAAWRI